jgi:pSer/pThr/pTyr-binding forkhead associated (FHA) protein
MADDVPGDSPEAPETGASAASSHGAHSNVGPSNDTTAHFTDEFVSQLAAMEAGISPEEQDAINALPSGSALLVVRRGPNVGARFLLDADSTVAGRHPDADIFLDDVTVSRRHAEFNRMGNAFQVHDLGSLNGTYFDGVRIESALLSDGAEVQVGKFRLTFYASRLDLASTSR